MANEKREFHSDPEPLLATIARLFANEGATKEVAILANSKAVVRQTDYDNWNGGTFIYALYLEIPNWLYGQISSDIKACEERILEKARPLLRPYPNDDLREVCISPFVSADKDWRDKAKAWLIGDDISNQGRVRSDNIPSRTVDGLLFRSQPEIHLYKALKSLGVSFAPLAVFIRGGENYRRIEPDFFIVKDGISMVVEVDGDTVHHETPAEAHDRTTMLAHEGVHIERVKASECESQDTARECAQKIMRIIEKLKATR